MTRFLFLLFSAFGTILILGCKEDPGTLDFSGDQDYTLAFTDTTRLSMSTVLLDSIPTSNTKLLIGKYNDPKLGLIESQTFFQIGVKRDNVFTPKSIAVYDSIALLMTFSKYYYGDTTASQTIEVREILEDFKTFNLSKFWIQEGIIPYFSKDAGSDEYDKLYNTSTIKVDENKILGETTFTPRPNSNDTVKVDFSDDLGTKIFDLAKNSPNDINFTSLFIDKVLRGVSIKCTDISGVGNIVSISTNVVLRIYYHEVDVKKYHDFVFVPANFFSGTVYNPSNNYNHIEFHGQSGSPLENLTHSNKIIDATLTDNETYIQAGTGLATKVTFPFIKVESLPGFSEIINDARLIIEPVDNSFNGQFPLPSTLSVLYTDNSNVPLYTAKFPRVYIKNEKNSVYTFNVTEFFQANKDTDLTNVGLMITADVDAIGTVNRAVIGSGKNVDYRARLEIRYLKKNQ